MVADGRLADRAALGELAGADGRAGRCQLPNDAEAHWVGQGGEELDVRVC
jgi:hypothetical protein